jgi:hypothetical protein
MRLALLLHFMLLRRALLLLFMLPLLEAPCLALLHLFL